MPDACGESHPLPKSLFMCFLNYSNFIQKPKINENKIKEHNNCRILANNCICEGMSWNVGKCLKIISQKSIEIKNLRISFVFGWIETIVFNKVNEHPF